MPGERGERGPSDFAEVARDRGHFDRLPDGEYSIERRRSKSHSSVVAYVGLAASLIVQVGAIAWYGGRLEQRVTHGDKVDDRHDREDQALAASIRELTSENNRQAQMIAGNNVAYQDIIRRLESIDRTMSSINDRRR